MEFSDPSYAQRSFLEQYKLASRRSRWKKNVFSVFILIAISLAGVKFLNNSSPSKLISPVSNLVSQFSFNLQSGKTFNFIFRSRGLYKVVSDSFTAQDVGDYAVYIEDLGDGEKYAQRATESYPSASLYKLFLMAAVLKEVEKGSLTLNSQVSLPKDFLVNKLGDIDPGYEDAGDTISYTVDEALGRVGSISDNFAAVTLGETVGWDKVQQTAQDLGTRSTVIKDPIQTSAFDVALFFKTLYQKKLISPWVSDKVMEYLKMNEINDRIPAQLPGDIQVIHKTGELSLARHDGGIVYLNQPAKDANNNQNQQRAYVIVVMSKNLQYEDEAVSKIASLSKSVFDYFKSKYD